MSTQFTFTFDSELTKMARRFHVDVSAAARDGVVAALRRAMDRAEGAAYRRVPQQPDRFWDDAEAWGADEQGKT